MLSLNPSVNPWMVVLNASVIPDDRLQEVRIRLLDEIKVTKKRIHRDLHPLFSLTMQNKIDHVNRILRLMDRYPQMTVKELLYLIECRTEGEKIFYFLLSLVGTYASRNL
jgi:hypothetical protein